MRGECDFLIVPRGEDTARGASVRQGKIGFADPKTGPLEGTNNKIQLMKRQAYGFRDQAFFKLKILGIHETKHALVG